MSWEPLERLEASRHRWIWTVVTLTLLLALFISITPDPDPDVVQGGIFFSCLTAVGLFFAARALLRSHRQVRRSQSSDSDYLEQMADDLREVDETLHRMARLVPHLHGEVATEAGLSAYATAERAAFDWRRLLRRQHELTEVTHGVSDGDARRSLDRVLTEATADVRRIEREVEEMEAALAELVAVSDDASLEAEIERVRASNLRLHALVDSIEEVEAIDRRARGEGPAPA